MPVIKQYYLDQTIIRESWDAAIPEELVYLFKHNGNLHQLYTSAITPALVLSDIRRASPKRAKAAALEFKRLFEIHGAEIKRVSVHEEVVRLWSLLRESEVGEGWELPLHAEFEIATADSLQVDAYLTYNPDLQKVVKATTSHFPIVGPQAIVAQSEFSFGVLTRPTPPGRVTQPTIAVADSASCLPAAQDAAAKTSSIVKLLLNQKKPKQ